MKLNGRSVNDAVRNLDWRRDMWPRRRARLWKGVGALAVLGFALAVLMTARAGDPTLYPPSPDQPATDVFVVDNGFHPDIALPREAIAGRGDLSAAAVRRLPAGPWIEVGWGDERFYKEEGLSLARAADGFRCLFWPTNRSVIRMQALAAPPDRIYPSKALTRLRLSKPGVNQMMKRLDWSFLSAQGALLVSPSARHDPQGVYFRSRERFSLLHMCNHWVADMLSAAGAPVTPMIDTLTAGLLLDLRLRAGAAPHAHGADGSGV